MEREGENVSEVRVEHIGSINVHGIVNACTPTCIYMYYRETHKLRSAIYSIISGVHGD